MRTWRHQATAGDRGERLDRVIERLVPELTRSRIKRLIDEGRILVDGVARKAGHPLREGETIDVEIPPPPVATLEPETIPVAVVYEDDHILVVDKPAGLSVHPGAGRDRGTLVNALMGRGTTLSGVGAPLRPGIVHRLDKDTSGLLVVAKTDLAHRILSRDLAARRVERRYWTLVWGRPDPEHGTVDAPVGRSRKDRRRMRVQNRGGRTAVTRYRSLWTDGRVTALWIALETGRTHQIRVHLRYRGTPVFGDPIYGGRSRRGAEVAGEDRRRVREALAALERQALHAAALRFDHPLTGSRLTFHSPLPEDIRGAARRLGVPDGIVDFREEE